MKKLTLILVSIVAATVLVAVGWWFGFQQRLLTEAFAVPTVDKHITETAKVFSILRQLDAGKIEDAKHMLRLQLDGNILTIDGLADYTDLRTREIAQKIFARIAEYRTQHPSSYTSALSRADAEVTTAIDSILKRAKESQK